MVWCRFWVFGGVWLLAAFGACSSSSPVVPKPPANDAAHRLDAASLRAARPAPSSAPAASASPSTFAHPTAAVPSPEEPVDCNKVSSAYHISDETRGEERRYFARIVEETSSGYALCRPIVEQSLRAAPNAEVSCYEAGVSAAQGVWVLIIAAPRELNARTPYSRWQVTYVPRAGAARKSAWVKAAADSSDSSFPGNDVPSTPVVRAIADLNGDGRSELVTAVDQWSDAAGNSFNRFEIWTPEARSVKAFAATRKLHVIDVVDTNDDGRPEFLIDPYGVSIGNPWGWVRAAAAWSLLVEIDAAGNLVRDGALSRKFARELCPDRDSLLKTLPETQPECVAAYVHCASLWQIPQAETRAGLDAFCLANSDDPLNWCEGSYAAWYYIAQSNPPFTL